MIPLQDLWQSPAPNALSKRAEWSIPVDILLSWPTPNYVDPVTRGPALYIVNGLFFAITLACVALRLYTRIWIRKYFGLDDLFICIAMVRDRLAIHRSETFGIETYDLVKIV